MSYRENCARSIWLDFVHLLISTVIFCDIYKSCELQIQTDECAESKTDVSQLVLNFLKVKFLLNQSGNDN